MYVWVHLGLSAAAQPFTPAEQFLGEAEVERTPFSSEFLGLRVTSRAAKMEHRTASGWRLDDDDEFPIVSDCANWNWVELIVKFQPATEIP